MRRSRICHGPLSRFNSPGAGDVPAPGAASRRSGRCNGNDEAQRGGRSTPGSRPRPPGGPCRSLPMTTELRRGLAPRRVGAAAPSGRPSTATANPRRRRDLVAWIALGLVVATVLTVVAHVSVAPPRHLAATKPAHRTASLSETSSTTIPMAHKHVHDHVRTHPGSTQTRAGVDESDRGRRPGHDRHDLDDLARPTPVGAEEPRGGHRDADTAVRRTPLSRRHRDLVPLHLFERPRRGPRHLARRTVRSR